MRKLEGRITAQSQAHVLQAKVEEAGLHHDEAATVTVRRVGVFPLGNRESVANPRFCFIEPIHVLARSGRGDDGEIPEEVRLSGFEFPEPGVYDLERVQLHTNGVIDLAVTNQSRIRRVGDLEDSQYRHQHAAGGW